ncbi:hypothetical protein FRC17_006203 [Serendipita sp. 399]|nr:hypothetical protein FRC17_006203 [Serendipita sp. 399]
MIEDSVELNEEQFRLDLKERSLSSLEALLTRLNARCRQLDLVARLPALPSVRKQNERDAETMMKKCEIVAQAIRDAKALEKEKGESDVQGEGPTFDEDRYRERLKPLGQVDLRQELAVLLKEKEALRKRIQESMSPEERQSAERQLSIADTKRVILLKMINQRVESDEIAFRSQLLNLTLASYPVQKFGGGLLPPIQPKVAAYAPFIEKQYLSQIRYQSSADLQKKSDALEQQSLVLTEEKQSDLSPQRKTEVENQLTIVDRKRAILSKLLREREEAVIRYKSSLAEKAASTSGEKTAVSALDSSEEIVDTDTASYSRSDTKNSVTSGKADMSSETFHDNARPPRSISNPEAYYWSSEALE